MASDALSLTGRPETSTITAAEIDLVTRIAKEPKYSGLPNVDTRDLIQAGIFGLLEARKRFDASRGASISTYAEHWIREAIRKEIDFHRAAVAIPESDRKDAERLRNTERRLYVELGRTPTVHELSANSGFDVDKVQRLVSISSAWGLGDIDASFAGARSETDLPSHAQPARTPSGRTGRPRKVADQPVTLLDALIRRCGTPEERIAKVCGVTTKTVKRWRNGEATATTKKALDGLYALFPFTGEPEELFRPPQSSDPSTGALSSFDEDGEHDAVY